MIRHTKLQLSLIVGLMLVLISSACMPSQKQITGADLELAYASGPIIKSTEYLYVFITNMSQGCIEFPHDFDLKIYFEKNGSWVETGNLESYPDLKSIQLSPNGETLDTSTVVLRPSLSGVQIAAPITLKATIHGNVCNHPNTVVEKEIPFTVVP